MKKNEQFTLQILAGHQVGGLIPQGCGGNRQGSPAYHRPDAESILVTGAQKLVIGKSLVYGRSIADTFIAWSEILPLRLDVI